MALGGTRRVSNTPHQKSCQTPSQTPLRIIGHPDLACGATFLRGNTLYVSIAEAIYRESRGEDVEVHLTPTEEDAEALSEVRVRARHRWESDNLPDGWTRPLPPPQSRPAKGGLPDELRRLAERFGGKEAKDSTANGGSGET